jgi:PTS system nitrogen regulatory IIA component
MTTLDTVLSPARIVLDLEDDDYMSVLKRLHALLAKDSRVVDAPRIWQGILDREKQGSTVLENGLAIPHARTEAVTGMIGAAARLKTPIQVDTSSVAHVFLVALPAALAADYLAVIGGLVRVFRSAPNLNLLNTACTPEEYQKKLVTCINKL